MMQSRAVIHKTRFQVTQLRFAYDIERKIMGISERTEWKRETYKSIETVYISRFVVCFRDFAISHSQEIKTSKYLPPLITFSSTN